MRLSLLLVTLLLAIFCWISPASAANPNQTNSKQTNLDPITQLLTHRSCIGCNLQGANLKDADLRGVNLASANLKNANLSGAKMLAVNLQGANLQGADLSNADMLVVDLRDANLKGAKVTGVNPSSLRFCHTIAEDGQRLDQDC